MKKRRAAVNAIGIPSLFLIFAVLCMVILSLLTFSASRSDLNTSRRAMEQTTAYYEAGEQATELCKSAELLLEGILAQARDEEDYWMRVEEGFSGEITPENESAGISYDSSAHRLLIHAAISEAQQLCVEADICYPAAEEACLQVLTWRSEASGAWEPDTSLFTKGE